MEIMAKSGPLTRMGKYSLGFVILVLVLSLFMGAVTGSLLSHIFGFEFLNHPISGEPLELVRNFYLIEKLVVRLTPAALLAACVAGWFLYRGRNR